ncbi:hypothetical protein HYT05_04780, partial [Candidatus Kaiserbacteria bacterium]|nr:hypothetical protein [Candidatus Kaiserbacteria bacterium]
MATTALLTARDGWLIFALSTGSLWGAMFAVTRAQAACPGICAGQATVGVRLATDGAGVLRHRARAQMLASGTVDPTTASADTVFELKAGESVTVKSAVRIGSTGTPVNGTLTLTVKFLEDNSSTVASSSASLSRALGAGDLNSTFQGNDLTFYATNNGLSSGTSKAGTYRIRIHMDYTDDVVNGTYTSDSDGNYSRTSGSVWQAGSAPDKSDKGYLRAGLDLSTINVSQTLGSSTPSTFAWPDNVRVRITAGAQALTADATLGITYKTLNGATPVRTMTSSVSKSGTTTWDDDGTGMALDTTDPTTFGVRIGDLANSPLSDRPWTHFESVPTGWSLGTTDGTKSVYASNGSFAYDSTVILSNLVNTDSGTSRVYNRGETGHGTIDATNARGSTFTPRGTETLTSIDTG